jgi:hypothetical protein
MIEKINIDLFPKDTVNENEYRKKMTEYVASHKEYIGGNYRKNPTIGQAEWNKLYPNGYDDWANSQQGLTSHGNQSIIDKINELVEWQNKQEEKKSKYTFCEMCGEMKNNPLASLCGRCLEEA